MGMYSGRGMYAPLLMLMGAMMGNHAGMDWGIKAPAPKPRRKCILPECGQFYDGNQLACCPEHFVEFTIRKKEAK